jgi:hypothetical protein
MVTLMLEKSSSKLAQEVTLLAFLSEISRSNLSRDTDYTR